MSVPAALGPVSHPHTVSFQDAHHTWHLEQALPSLPTHAAQFRASQRDTTCTANPEAARTKCCVQWVHHAGDCREDRLRGPIQPTS